MKMFEIEIPAVPQWLGRMLAGLVVASMLWVAAAFAQSGFITPSDVLERVEENQNQIILLQKQVISLQERVTAVLEGQAKRLDRLERNEDSRR